MNEKKAVTRDEAIEEAMTLLAKYDQIIEGSEAVIADSLQCKAEIEDKLREVGIEL
jgi:riboflavin biosynthesis pyrimidine reductase